MADTVPQSTSSVATLAVGGSLTGTIEFDGDEDWYRVSLTAGTQYRFELKGLDSGSGTLDDPVLRLLNVSGFELAFNDDSGLTFDSSLTFTATTTGIHFLSAEGFIGSTGTFLLSAVNLGGGGGSSSDTVGASAATASSIAVGATVSGTVNTNGDQDWYGVTLVAGHQYRFDLQGEGSGNGTLADPLLRLLSSGGAQLASNDDIDLLLDSRILFTAASTGTYYLSAQAFGSDTGSFELSVADLGVVSSGPTVDTVAGNTSTGATLAVGSPVSGTIDTGGDIDWYRVSLIAGHQYSFEMKGADSGNGTLADPWLVLYDAGGTYLGYNNDFGGSFNAKITYTATQTGTYYLSAEPYDLVSETGTFTLSATDIGTVGVGEIAGNTTSTASVAVGGSVSGAIDSLGDEDWYRVSLIAGHQYSFSLQGQPTGQGTLPDTVLSLMDGSGNELAFNDDFGISLNSGITFTAAQSGTYFLAAQAFADAYTGSFLLSAADLGGGAGGSDIVPADTSTPRFVTMGDSVTGVIDSNGDQDWYRVDLVAGHQYRFNLRGDDSGGELGDPLLMLLNGSGVLIEQNDDAGGTLDSRIIFVPTASGTYFLSAQGFGASVGSFVLSATDLNVSVIADVAGNASTSATVNLGGAAAGTIDSAGDQDWFRITLTAGHQYRFELRGTDSGQGTLPDPLLQLLSGGSAVLATNDDAVGGDTFDSIITFTALQSGVHYLSAQGFSTETGTFLLTATDLTTQTSGGSAITDILGLASTLNGTANNDQVFGLDGNDTLEGKDGDDALGGGPGADTLTGGPGNDTITGGQGPDLLLDNFGINYLNGSNGHDVFIADEGINTATGGPGNDRYVVSTETTTARTYYVTDFTPGPGGDRIDVSELLQSSFNIGAYDGTNALASGILQLVQSGPNVELMWDRDGSGGLYSPTTQLTLLNVQASSITPDNFYGQLLTGTKDDDLLLAGPGNDTIVAGEGHDTLQGSLGADSMVGGLGGDYYYVDNVGDLVIETASLPQQALAAGLSEVADLVFSSIDYVMEGVPNLENLTLTGLAQTGIGNAQGNEIVGNANNNTLAGGDGNDSILGLTGADNISGSLGNDVVQGNQGNDTVNGNQGNDDVRGGQDNDFLYGGQDQDIVRGALGTDYMEGNLGNDTMFGGQHNDTLLGGDGDDELQGLLNNDVLTGGAGVDRFSFNTSGAANADTITDFQAGVDKIALLGAVFTAQTFGSNILYNQGNGQISYDADAGGGGAASLIATVTPGTVIGASDFLFV